MVKKEFTECKMEVVVFKARDIIETSGGFEGVVDVFSNAFDLNNSSSGEGN